MRPLSVTRPMQRSWLGRAGVEFTLHFDRSGNGRRVSVIRWLDTSEVSVRAIKGDGRTTTFREFEASVITLPPDADWQAQAAHVARAMAGRHFAQ